MLLVFGTRPPKDDPPATQRYALGVRDVLDRVLDVTEPTVLLEGGAQGPDLWARHLAGRADRVAAGWSNRSEEVTEREWATLGRRAGPLRNARMASILKEQLGSRNRLAVGFWDGSSSGTKSMIEELHRVACVPFVFYVGPGWSVEWPSQWRYAVVKMKDQTEIPFMIGGAGRKSARVMMCPYPSLLTMRWEVVYRNLDAAEWTFEHVAEYRGWPVERMP